MKRIIVVALIALLALSVCGCKDKWKGESDDTTIGAGSGEDGKQKLAEWLAKSERISSDGDNVVYVGQVVYIELEENQSVPFRWAPVVSDKKLVKLVFDDWKKSKDTPEMPGAGGESHWFFYEAKRAGKCVIDMYYADMREKGITNYDKISFTLIIQGGRGDGNDVTEAPGETPSDAEIEAAYLKADEAYKWFTYTTMPLAADTKEYEGLVYQRVDFPGVSSFDGLREYLMTIFAPNIAAGLVSAEEMQDHYREFDGVLYAQAADGVPGLSFGGLSSEIIRNDDGSITYRVTTAVLDEETFSEIVDYKIHNLTYANMDGDWLFIWFEDVYGV